jgi:hypothetical protein
MDSARKSSKNSSKYNANSQFQIYRYNKNVLHKGNARRKTEFGQSPVAHTNAKKFVN